MGHKSLKLFF